MKSCELANELEFMLNNMGSQKDEDEFVDGIMRMHRTLQQKAAGLMFKAFARWAQCEATGNYDLRNEATCQAARLIIEQLDKNNYFVDGQSCLPFI